MPSKKYSLHTTQTECYKRMFLYWYKMFKSSRKNITISGIRVNILNRMDKMVKIIIKQNNPYVVDSKGKRFRDLVNIFVDIIHKMDENKIETYTQLSMASQALEQWCIIY